MGGAFPRDVAEAFHALQLVKSFPRVERPNVAPLSQLARRLQAELRSQIRECIFGVMSIKLARVVTRWTHCSVSQRRHAGVVCLWRLFVVCTCGLQWGSSAEQQNSRAH